MAISRIAVEEVTKFESLIFLLMKLVSWPQALFRLLFLVSHQTMCSGNLDASNRIVHTGIGQTRGLLSPRIRSVGILSLGETWQLCM